MNVPTTIVMAGGGTAGHAEPALAVADALAELHPSWSVEFLGTATGIESRLVPARGYALHLIPRVPLPRRPSLALLALPVRLWSAVRAADAQIRHSACLVGFGGYVSMPAYLAARWRGVPIVVHEQNARAGIANRIGARWAAVRASTFSGSLAGAHVVGLPLRPSIATMAAQVRSDRVRARAQAREALGLRPDVSVLLVTGGSQGSARINAAVADALPDLLADGWQVVHALGERNPLPAAQAGYHPVAYLDRMEQALAAADLMIGRAGAGTCAEVAALALPAIFIPLPIGNGEQELNARDLVASGAAILVPDAECTGERIVHEVRAASRRLPEMHSAMVADDHLQAAHRMAVMIVSLVQENARS